MSGKIKWFVVVLLAWGIFSGAAQAELIAHYPFEEGQGTQTADVTGNGNDGTINGDVTWVPGHIGSAVHFDDAGERIVIGPIDPSSENNAMTLAAWINWEGLGHSRAQQGIIGKRLGWDPGTGVKWFWQAQPSGALLFRADWAGGGGTGLWWGNTQLEPYANQWIHVALTWDDGTAIQYINGEEVSTGNITFQTTADDTPVTIGCVDSTNNEHFVGIIDEVRIYDVALTPEEIKGVMIGVFPQASAPNPEDGALNEATWVTLTWKPGTEAVSHDVYFSDSFADVNEGTADAFQGNRSDATFIVGFPGFPYPDGLVPGTTYYWRIDEVNEADPNSPWRGDVWSFWIPLTNAYAPSPADGARYIDREPTLSWQPGFGAKLHNVVFGDNPDEVKNALTGSSVIETTFTPGQLEAGKTYYWRVDELDPPTTIKGDVWTFTTLPDIPIADPDLVGWWKLDEGAGTTVVDWSGHGNHGTFVGEPSWADGIDGGAVVFDGKNDYINCGNNAVLDITDQITLSVWVKTNDSGNGQHNMWLGKGDHAYAIKHQTGNNIEFFIYDGDWYTAQYAVDDSFNGLWHHVAGTYDGTALRVYLDGELVVTEPRVGSIEARPDVVAIGNNSEASGRFYEGAIDDARIYNRALTADEIRLAMRGDTARAWDPSPPNGRPAGIDVASTLSWSAGDGASEHDVYFGTGRDAVAAADASDASGVYKGRRNATSYTPDGVTMNSGPFYWRIDEVAADGASVEGTVWSFSVTDHILIDDFESYNDIPAGESGSNLVYATWVDGFDNPTANGSTMGYVTGVSLETVNVHGGRKSVPFGFNNTAAPVSEVVRTFTTARDWTAYGIVRLSLWFAGDPANVPGQLYVKINGVRKDYDGNADNLRVPAWQPWDIDLATVGGNLQRVTSMAIGIQGGSASGTLLLDDIKLYAQPAEPAEPVLLSVPRTAVAPVIDGQWDSVWNGIEETRCLITDMVNTASAAPENADDLSAIFKAAYDDNNFYVFVEVRDSVIDYEFSNWQGDGVEIYFDGDISRGSTYDGVNDNQIRITVDDVTLADIDSSLAIDGTQFKVLLTDAGYNIEAAFPLARLQISPLPPNNIIGFEMQINDNDGGGGRETLMRWHSDDNNSWQDPSLFGVAQLSSSN